MSGQATRWKQPRYAVAGWDAVAAPVTATDWLSSYPHVLGANLGLSASTYLAGGGFRFDHTAEDQALVESPTAAGFRAGPMGHAPLGFSHLLSPLAVSVQPGTA